MRILFAVIFLLASILLIGLGQNRRLARIEFSDKQPSGWSINTIKSSYSTLYHLSDPDGIYRGMVRIKDNRLLTPHFPFRDFVRKSSSVFLKNAQNPKLNMMRIGEIDIGWTSVADPSDSIRIANVRQPEDYMGKMYFIRNSEFTLTANLYFKRHVRKNERKFRKFLCRLMKFESPQFINH
ncbi:hypothetical protein P0136_04075 [Lentisphaerota bacterium ZTH]|nr:hypothetical protein JYG24_04810 [Lentisphaerota bacterium]WET07174.1 hypothetical protein P0136_04075 [Lentisphaerota bacterium ZTH]